MPTEWDVVVVGGGPAGSASAALLAGKGFRVVLVDRAHFPRPKACAEYMSPGVIEALERLGAGDTVRRAGPRMVAGMDIVSPGGATLTVEYMAETGTMMASTLPRKVLDALLLTHAAERGTEVVEGFVAHTLMNDAGVVRGVTGTHNGRRVDIRGRLTLIADGSRSVLARSIGLARPPRWPIRLGLVAHYEGTGLLRDTFGQMHVGADGYCGVAPLPAGLLNVATVVREDAVRRSPYNATEFFERWISARPSLERVLRDCRRVGPVRGVGPVGSRSSRAWAPGALLVGDAATFFDPFTGEGIYRALRGAELASDVASEALDRGDVSAGALSRYDSDRRRAFSRKEAVTALVQMFVQYPRLMDYAVPRLQQRTVPAHTLGLVLGDVVDAREFLRPRMLWSALRP